MFYFIFKAPLNPRQPVSPGQEVLQGSGLVLLLAGDPVPLLLVHLCDAWVEGVDVVQHGRHGDRNLVLLLQVILIRIHFEWVGGGTSALRHRPLRSLTSHCYGNKVWVQVGFFMPLLRAVLPYSPWGGLFLGLGNVFICCAIYCLL